MGRVPALRNSQYVNLILVLDDDYLSGYVRDYRDGETETSARTMMQLQKGDVIDYVADYCSYDGTYQDSCMAGDKTVYDGSFEVSDVEVPEKLGECYRMMDLYGNAYWTSAVEMDHR